MQKSKTKEQQKLLMSDRNSSKKVMNQFKTLYKISKQKRQQNIKKQHETQKNYKKCERSKQYQDSLDCGQILNEEKEQNKIRYINDSYHHSNDKKSNHYRSNSCPLVNPLNCAPKQQKQITIYNKVMVEEQGKRTLKKSSLHRKNRRLNKKYPAEFQQNSQESNTIIVHSLPIQQLSSMLYSINHEKEKSCKKRVSSSQLHLHLFQINSDPYFQTRLHQQIKIYNLNQQLIKLHEESDNIKIKQEVLQKLANKFEKQNTNNEEEDSLLIH